MSAKINKNPTYNNRIEGVGMAAPCSLDMIHLYQINIDCVDIMKTDNFVSLELGCCFTVTDDALLLAVGACMGFPLLLIAMPSHSLLPTTL